MNWKLALALLMLAVPGAIVSVWLGLPLLLAGQSLPLPLATMQLAAAGQTILIVLVAAGVGTLSAAKVGLQAPVISMLLNGTNPWPAWRSQCLPGAVGGLIGCGIIVGFYRCAPAELAPLHVTAAIPLSVRLLYGGITEEILLRWGLMSSLVWVCWRLLEGGTGRPTAIIMWAAIGLSALMFGISHLPSAEIVLGKVSGAATVYIVAGNAAFGVVAGYLFWRYGLEAAIAAHVLAHLLAKVVGL